MTNGPLLEFNSGADNPQHEWTALQSGYFCSAVDQGFRKVYDFGPMNLG